MPARKKADYPVDKTRWFLEPGPIVLISSAWRGETNVMTLGWHMMLDYAKVGFYLWDANHSFDLIRRSRQCVINLPTVDMVDTVVGIGNCSGRDVDKFDHFGLTAVDATHVDAPLIGECHASFECRLSDGNQIRKHGLFVWDIVKAHVARTPKRPRTVHYRGEGEFMVAGAALSRRARFKPQNL